MQSQLEKDFYSFFSQKNNNSNLVTFLFTITGVGIFTIKPIMVRFGFSKNIKPGQIITHKGLLTQLLYLQHQRKNEIYNGIEKKKRLKNYAGLRHLLKLPVRGQRTHTNANTAKRNEKKEL